MPKILFASLILAGVSLSFAKDAKHIRDLVESKQGIHSFDEILREFSSEYRSHYTVMYHSGSEQGASEDNPRVIMYGRDAKTILGFNGHPSQKGFNTLEMIQFNDETKEFEFYQISFQDGKRVTMSPPNPKACTECHGTPPRPNWEQYDKWPGAFGSDEDRLYDDEKERSKFKEFANRNRKDTRYGWLENLKENYAPQDSDANRYMAKFTKAETNARFTSLLGILNAKRMAKRLMSSPSYEKNKWRIAMTILGCRKDPDANWRVGYSSELTDFYALEKLNQEAKLGIAIDRSNWALVRSWNRAYSRRGRGFQNPFWDGSVGFSGVFDFGLAELDPEFAALTKNMTRKKVYEGALTEEAFPERDRDRVCMLLAGIINGSPAQPHKRPRHSGLQWREQHDELPTH